MGGVGLGNEVGAHSSPSGLLNELSHSICKLIPACSLQEGATGRCLGSGVGVFVGGPGRVLEGGGYAAWGERS